MLRGAYINVSERFGPEYVPLANDLARTAVIQLLVHVLVSAVDDGTPFLSGYFWLVLMYVLLGVLCYHLLFARLVTIL
jgi:hypothetical protein